MNFFMALAIVVSMVFVISLFVGIKGVEYDNWCIDKGYDDAFWGTKDSYCLRETVRNDVLTIEKRMFDDRNGNIYWVEVIDLYEESGDGK